MRDVLHGAVSQWRDEVESGTFPGPEHSFDED
jgi:ketopantoate hydroxymethyltransferase